MLLLEPEAGAIVFTDIIDSTATWDVSEPIMWDALVQHQQITRAAMTRFGGYEIKTLGDGFLTSFTSARCALHFCIGVQNALAQHQWSDTILAARRQQDALARYTGRPRGLIIRMGLHWGIPFRAIIDPVAQRKDFYGNFVNVSSRFQSEAEGDEIAVSDALLVRLNREQMMGQMVQLGEDAGSESVRTRILERELSIANFGVSSKGLRSMKGVRGQQHVTIISLLR